MLKALSLSLISSAALASGLEPLALPTGLLPNGGRSCIADTVLGDDTVHGFCQSESPLPHYVNRYIFTLFDTHWDKTGIVLSSTECSLNYSPQTQIPSSYQPGYSAANCYAPSRYFQGLTQILIGNQWYGYITTASDGSEELLTKGLYGEIYIF